MSHLDEGQLTCLLDGELSADERKTAERHLAGCADCRRLYDEVRALATEADGLVAAVEPAPRPATPPAPPVPAAAPRPATGTRPWRSLAWAATLVAALGLGYFARTTQAPATVSDIGQAEPSAAAARPDAPPGERLGASAARSLADTPALPPGRAEKSAGATPAAPPASLGARQESDAGAGRANAELSEEARSRADHRPAPLQAADQAAPQPPAAAPAATGAVASAKQLNRQPVAGFQQVGMEEAVRTLGGSIRLLDGLRPERVLTAPGRAVPGAVADLPVIRVVYEDPPGRELWLDQQRVGTAGEGYRAAEAPSLLPGDTVASSPAQGMHQLRWLDQSGFRLGLTGYLPADSLRGLMRRVH